MKPGLKIRPPAQTDAADLLAFELANRCYFEAWINARADDYYSLDGVCRAIAAAECDRANDRAYQHLIIAESGIVGRINLTAVRRPYYNEAELGYRIGQAFAGNGYASAAVNLALQEAFVNLGLWRVTAAARPDNAASLRALERNAFRIFGRAERCFRLHGTWFDLVHLERHNDLMEPDTPAAGLSNCRLAPASRTVNWTG